MFIYLWFSGSKVGKKLFPIYIFPQSRFSAVLGCPHVELCFPSNFGSFHGPSLFSRWVRIGYIGHPLPQKHVYLGALGCFQCRQNPTLDPWGFDATLDQRSFQIHGASGVATATGTTQAMYRFLLGSLACSLSRSCSCCCCWCCWWRVFSNLGDFI